MSLKTSVESAVINTRKSFMQTPIKEFNDPTPHVNTKVGISYHSFSNIIVEVVLDAQKRNSQLNTKELRQVEDALYLSPRFTQWHSVEIGFRLFTARDEMSVNVTPERTYITKGRQVYEIYDGLEAATLFSAIHTAQGLIGAIKVTPMTEEEQAEYFASDPAADGADIDSALADSEAGDKIDEDEAFLQMVREAGNDAELTEETLNEDTDESVATIKSIFDLENEILDSENEISQIELEGDKTPKYASRMNRKAEADAAQINVEYKDKDPVQDYPKTANTMVINRLKSLQGRLLNIIEAALPEKTQREAVKTLINKEFRREMNNFNRGKEFSTSDE